MRAREAKLRDVAQTAGVSPGTASRVLSGSSYPVALRTRLRVEEAAKVLDYVPNSIARALVTGRSAIVGAVVHDITDPFFNEVVRGLEDAAAASGESVLIGNDDRDSGKLERYLMMMLSHNATGVVLVGGEVRDPAASVRLAHALQLMRNRRIPVVSVGRYELDIPNASVDNGAAAGAAASHLLELGHRRIAFIGGPLNSTTVEDRHAGYATALLRTGIPVNRSLVIETPLSRQGGSQGMVRLLKSGAAFTAVLAANDEVAFGVISALRAAGRSVPDEISVVGINDVPMAAYVDPPLTTIHVPMRELGRVAWELLQRREDATGEVRRELPSALVIRGSTARVHAVPGEGEG